MNDPNDTGPRDAGIPYQTPLERLIIEWQGYLLRNCIDVITYPDPSRWHDVLQALEYERDSMPRDASDQMIATNVRACWFVADIGRRYDAL